MSFNTRFSDAAPARPARRWPVYLGLGLLALFLVSFFIVHYTSSTVQEGYVGVSVTLGRADERLLGPGPNLVMPFLSRIETLDVRPRTYEFKDSAAGSREQQPLKVSGAVIYHWDAARALALYRNPGWRFDTALLPPKVNDHLKVVIAEYQAYDAESKTGMNVHRAEIGANTRDRLAAELLPYGIVVDSVAISNFDFDDTYEAAIVKAQVEEQNTRAETERALVEAQKANQVAAKADGDRRAAIAQAQGEAEKVRLAADAEAHAITAKAEAQSQANQRLRDSLSPDLIEYQRVQKWNGSVPQVQMSGAATPLLSLPATR